MKFNDTSFDFKELVNTFAYTTATQNRDVCTEVSINGRKYDKYGTLQAVAFVGNLYKVNIKGDGYWPREKGPISNYDNKYVLIVGMSKQHPCDTKVNKELGYEIAAMNALEDPIIILDIQGKFTYRRFKNIVENYLANMKLEFIKTKAEMIAEGKDPKKYNR